MTDTLEKAITDTLEKAIDWMDRALRETRETLAEVDPDKREEATRKAENYLGNRAIDMGALHLRWVSDRDSYFSWCRVKVVASAPALTIFDMWLAAARAKAGAQ